MAKAKQKFKLQKRDWAIIVLFVSIIVTNWVWYQYSTAQDITNKSGTSSWLSQQVQINKLKACIDESIRPCDITQPR